MARLDYSPDRIRRVAARARLLQVESLARVGVGHLGGCLSCTDILAALYFGAMDVDPCSPRDPARDRLVLSKGHAGPALYSILALRGFFPVDLLATINEGGTDLPSHVDMNRTPGVDMTAGSLGQGISAACGMAYAAKLGRRNHHIYCIVGDGECQEGEVWEAAMAAAAFGLDNLTVISDYNKLQIDGFVQDVVSLEPFADKWRSFGWRVMEIDGHSIEGILCALAAAREGSGRPACIIAHTTKGKGLPSAENKIANHNMTVTSEHAIELKASLAPYLTGGTGNEYS